MAELIQLRLATMGDANHLLAWRNDEASRRFSLNSEVVSEQHHQSWLQRSLKDPQRQLYIAESGGQPIGTLRVDTHQHIHTISWTLAPDFRGKGLAKAMVALLVRSLTGDIVAQILPDNTASVRVAEYAGLIYQHTKNGVMYYSAHQPKVKPE
jgi:RimJ/RimL family protein N-acetyltransferase